MKRWACRWKSPTYSGTFYTYAATAEQAAEDTQRFLANEVIVDAEVLSVTECGD